MKYAEWDDSNTLCCCEYYNIEEERSHILGCCCNCVDLDETFERLLRGDRIPSQQKSQVMATIQDRVRIPWRGGAKQISADTLVPVILVPALIFVAAYDLILTLIIFILTPIFLNHTYHWLQANHPKSKFFAMWTIMSVLTVALIFEIKVISLLEILPEENLALLCLSGLTIVTIFRVKCGATRMPPPSPSLPSSIIPDHQNKNNDLEDFCTNCKRRQQERMYHCSICQNCMADHDFHFVWFDCCIGNANKGFFLFSLILAMATLLYSTNLTLTTVCHPFTVFGTVMLPDDCSEVYQLYDMSLCFTSAIYSILMVLYLFYIYARHVLIISIGLTGQEWLQLPCSTRLRCGLFSTRPYDQGIIKNWLKVFSTNDRNNRPSTYFET